MKINILNKMIYEKYQLVKTNHFSSPLLVNPNQIEANPKIMYIGQETNTWGDGLESQLELEDKYEEFLLNGATGKDFWKFIKDIISNQDIYNNVIWTNALIAGRKDAKGLPHEYDLLFDISVEYLVELYNLFKPDKVIIVAGPKDPYYQIIINFFSKIDVATNMYPTINNPLIKVDNNIYWTYHPNFLNKKHLKTKIIEQLKSR